MRFGILGPLEVAEDGGHKLELGGHRQRSLLAILLLHANEVVPPDRLMEELWSGRLPASATTSLQAHVSRLRRALGEEGRIAWTAGGYLLRVAAGELDLDRFERLVEEGASALSSGDRELALRQFRDALALWRGPPLSDFQYDEFAQAEIARLSELQIAAVEQRIEVELGLGREAGVIGELEHLVREHPYRERLRGQLMLALYRTGRQPDALASYRQLCDVLREELGLQPSESLRELEQAILNHDPSLMPSPAEAPTPAAGRLPAPATPFLGRAREVAEVVALLRGGAGRLVTLTGAGGSGKTRLAVRVAQECAGDYVAGAWFVGFSDITDPGLILPAICQALGLAEQPDLTPAHRLEGYLRERELLLVLDNLEQLTRGVTVLGELLTECEGVRMLVTSREPLRLAGEQQYAVPVLDPDDAIALFTARARTVAPNLIIERDCVGAVCERLDRLPLAIELAAARAKVLSPAEILHRLERRLPVLGSGPRDAPQRQRTLQATLDWSYELLTDQEQRLFTRLSVFTGGCTLEAAEAVCDAELDTLEALVDRSLLRADGGRYRMLQTLREYALEKLACSGEEDALPRRHAQWFVAFAKQADEHTRSPDQAIWLSRLDAETENLRAALAWSLEHDIPRGVELASTLFEPWAMHGRTHELIDWCERALASPTGINVQTRAEALKTYGEALDIAERHEHAQQAFHESLTLFRKVRDRRAEADVLAELALAAWQAGWDQEVVGSDQAAIGFAEAALGISRELQHQAGTQRALQIVGTCRRDDPTQAAATLEQALAIAHERGDRYGAASILHSLGDLALDRDDSEQAAHHYRDALETATELGSERLETYCVAGLACVAALRGEILAAGQLWTTAEAMQDRLRRRMEPTSRKRYERILIPLSEHEQFRKGQQAGREPPLDEALRQLTVG